MKKIILLTVVVISLCQLAGCAPKPTTAPATTPPPATTLPQSRPVGRLTGLEMRRWGNELPALDLATATRATWARFTLRWTLLQPRTSNPAYYDWAKYDRLIGDLSRHGFQTVITIRDNPQWASSTPCGALNEQGQAAFPQMLTEVVRRYSGEPYGVKHWEIYNEPDNADPIGFPKLGGCWGKDPAAYAALLKSAYTAIKAADPQAIVIFGGLALEKFDDSPFNVDFLKQALAAGGGPYFDWVGYHYYPAFSYRWDKFGHGVEGKANYIRKVLKDAGLDKPLACSEIGQPSAGPPSEKYSDELAMAQVFKEHAQASAADLQFAIWYCLQDFGDDERYYGLLDTESKPKPAYATYQTVVKALSDARFERILTRDETGSDNIEAYRYALPGAPYRTLLIAWRKDNGPAIPMPIPVAEAWITDTAGRDTTLADSEPGDMNPASGALSVGISPNPVLIRY